MNISPIQLAPGTAPVYLDYNRFCELASRIDGGELQMQGDGDPLLHLHFFRMVRHAAERGLRVTTTTLLTVFPEYRAAECVASGLYAMHVALDAANTALYRELHGKDCFSKVVRNVRRLMAARATMCRRRPRVILACLATRKTLHQLPDLVQLAHDERFDAMRVQWPGEETHSPSSAPEPCFQTMRFVPARERLEHEDPERIVFYFGRALMRSHTLGVALRLPAPDAAPTPQDSS